MSRLVILSSLLCLFLAPGVLARTVTYDVRAADHSVARGPGLQTGLVLQAGQPFIVTVDPDDTWSLLAGAPVYTSTADGLDGFAPYNVNGLFAPLGVLAARVGLGAFFVLGSSFDGVAPNAGVLSLFAWDFDHETNAGGLWVTVTVPEPPAVPAPAGIGWGLLLAFGALLMLRRRAAGRRG